MQLLAFLSALALLVGNAAAGLAGGLAGGLAFAAAAVLGAVAQVTSLDGLDVLHGFHLPYADFYPSTLPYPPGTVNPVFYIFHSGGVLPFSQRTFVIVHIGFPQHCSHFADGRVNGPPLQYGYQRYSPFAV